MLNRRMIALAMLVAALAGTGAAAGAADLPAPVGPVVLEVRGKIGRTNAPGAARFDLDMLRGLGVVTVTTATPWTDGQTSFEAVSGRALLEAVAATGSRLVAQAINDYRVEIPAEDLRDKGAILAFAMNGKRLTARDKGPLWLLYPFDDRPDLRAATYYSRSVWQLKAIEVE